MQRWTVHLDGGPRRVNHAAVLIGCHIYSFGGYCTGENFEIVRPIDVHILNTGQCTVSFYLCIYFVPERGAKYYDYYVNLFVCLSVCLPVLITQKG